MSEPLIGSRYELHVARKGAAESKTVHDYFAVHRGTSTALPSGASHPARTHWNQRNR